jgi:cytochrome b
LIGAALPFVIYAIGGTRPWFWLGLGVAGLVLLRFNLWGHETNGAAPRVRDWSHFAAGVVGLAGAWAVQRVYRKARPPHRPSIE